MSDLQQPPVPDTQGRGCIYATLVFVVLIISLPFLLSYLKNQSDLRFQEHLAVKRAELFEKVKQGESHVSIFDPLLLPMLAADEDCIRNLTSIDFFMTSVGPEEAKHIAKLTNLKTIGFYDTGGTEHVIEHARGLGVENVWYDGVYYFSEEQIRHLAEFPQLKQLDLGSLSSEAEKKVTGFVAPPCEGRGLPRNGDQSPVTWPCGAASGIVASLIVLMSQPPTFLRFTTRGLLLVTLGLSIGLAIAFSLLPPLLGVTRGQMAMMLGWYSVGILIHAAGVTLRRMWLTWQAGEWLLSLYPPATQLSTRFVAVAPLGASGVFLFIAPRVMESGMDLITCLVLAGVLGGAACRLFLWGREVTALELRKRGVVCDSNRFVPWGLVRIRTPHSVPFSQPRLDLYFDMKWHSFELSESAMQAVERVLTKHKPGYAELANFE